MVCIFAKVIYYERIYTEYFVSAKVDGIDSRLAELNTTVKAMNLRPDYIYESMSEEDLEEHPAIDFWTKKSWLDYLKGTTGHSPLSEQPSSKDTIKKKFRFLQDHDGALISNQRLAAMSTEARGIFEEMVIEKAAPLKWASKVTAKQRHCFCVRMQAKFKELRYCEDGWKANQLAILLYPGFKQNRPDYRPYFNSLRVLEDDGDEDDEDDGELDYSAEDETRAQKSTNSRASASAAMPSVRRRVATADVIAAPQVSGSPASASSAARPARPAIRRANSPEHSAQASPAAKRRKLISPIQYVV